MLVLILGISLALQVVAALQALRLSRITGMRVAWVGLALAVAIMAVRNGIELWQLLTSDAPVRAVSTTDFAVLAASMLVLAAALAMKPIFQAARKSANIENRFGRILDSSLYEIYMFHADSLKFVQVNEGARRNLGYSAEELADLTPVDLKPDFDEPTFRKLLAPLYRGRQSRLRFATRHRRKDGSEYPVEVDLQLASGIDEKMFVAVIQNLTDKMVVESALAESNEHFRALVENLQDVITEIDESGNIVYHSPSIERVMGYTPQERLGRSSLELVHADDRARVSEALEMVLSGSASTPIRYRMRHKDGSWRTIEAAGSVRRTAHGAARIVINQRDITDRELAKSQLLQAQKMETIGTLAGGIAHDLNNLLAPIMGYADLLKDDVKDGAQVRYVDEILVASKRAQQLIRQILTYSRQDEYERVAVSVADVLDEAIRLVRATIPATVRLRIQIERDVGTVFADVTQLHQVVMNLCANAHQAMQPHGGTLSISVDLDEIEADDVQESRRLRAGTYVRLKVADSGKGMDAATLKQIFEPFFTTKGPAEGTGLGLSVAQSIVVNHGGDLIAESVPGKGTVFTAWFPKADCEPVPRHEIQNSVAVEGHEHVLLVDDEEAITTFVTEILERTGYRVTRTNDPSEAMKLIETADAGFDLLLTDQTMPGVTGIHLAEAVRQKSKGIHIIVMSGNSENITAADAEELGIDAILSKPFSALDLKAAIRSALGSFER